MGSETVMLRSINMNPSTTSKFPVILINQFKSLERRSGQARVTISGRSESDLTIQRDAVSHGVSRCETEPQIITDLGLLIFQISNKLSKGNRHNDKKLLSKLGNRLKTMALTSLSWQGLLTAGEGPTSWSLIEQLFHFSITVGDVTLARMMIQIGADPDQQVWVKDLGVCVSALEFAVRSRSTNIVNLLLNSGAAHSQRSLAYAIIAGDFDTADRLLQSDPRLDINFNYLDDLEAHSITEVRPLKFETVTLLGLVCLEHRCSRCLFCRNDRTHTFYGNEEYDNGCRVRKCIVSLGYLLRHRAVVTIDTMILASFTVNVVALQFLMQRGGNVCGVNKFGFSCLDGACLRDVLCYDLVHLLLHSWATTNTPRTYYASSSQDSPLPRLLLHRLLNHEFIDHRLLRILDLMVNSGADINYRIRHLGSASELNEARERFLWSQPSEDFTPMDRVVQAKAESTLEYAIVNGHDNVALGLIHRGCQLTGRESKLAAKFGLVGTLQQLRNHGQWDADSGKNHLRLALRWGHSRVVQSLVEDGIKFGDHDMVDTLHYPGTSVLSTKIQIEVIRATPDLDRRKLFGLPLLELCCLKLSGAAVREILERYPAAYNSGALCAIILRALECHSVDEDGINAMLSRRTGSSCDWDKENTALMIAAMYNRPDILRILVTPDTAYERKTARVTKDVFSRILEQRYEKNLLRQMDPTLMLGSQDWVACSPLVSIVTTPADGRVWINQSVFEDMLDHLLACSYEPDALTVVVAAASGHRAMHVLRRFQHLRNWRSIVSIDNHDRPRWCPTALQVAASEGNEEVVELLLDSGVSVNEKPAEQPLGHRMPRTALQAAIENGNLRLIDLFLEHGADINAPAAEDSGATALQVACIQGNLDLSLRLLELGAGVNAKGAPRSGRTALEGAAEHGRIDTIQLLLNYGASTDGPRRDQYIKAVIHAERNQNFTAAALLKEHRAWTDEDEACYNSLQSYEWCDVQAKWHG